MGKLYFATALLAVLKVAGFVTWPWVWVVSPVWIEAMLILCFVIICAAFLTKKAKDENDEVVEAFDMPLLEAGDDQADVSDHDQVIAEQPALS